VKPEIICSEPYRTKDYFVKPHIIYSYPYTKIEPQKGDSVTENIDFDEKLETIKTLIAYILCRKSKYEPTYAHHPTYTESYSCYISLNEEFDSLLSSLPQQSSFNIELISQMIKDMRMLLLELYALYDSEESFYRYPYDEEKIESFMVGLQGLLHLKAKDQEESDFDAIFSTSPRSKRKNSFS
jgi:hypothetical protein